MDWLDVLSDLPSSPGRRSRWSIDPVTACIAVAIGAFGGFLLYDRLFEAGMVWLLLPFAVTVALAAIFQRRTVLIGGALSVLVTLAIALPLFFVDLAGSMW